MHACIICKKPTETNQYGDRTTFAHPECLQSAVAGIEKRNADIGIGITTLDNLTPAERTRVQQARSDQRRAIADDNSPAHWK